VNCVTLAAGCSTPQVYNVNWVVPPAWYILQKWWGHVSPSSYGGAALGCFGRLALLDTLNISANCIRRFKDLGLEAPMDQKYY